VSADRTARQDAEWAALLARHDAERRAAGYGPLPIVRRLTDAQTDTALRALAKLAGVPGTAAALTRDQQTAVHAVIDAVHAHDTVPRDVHLPAVDLDAARTHAEAQAAALTGADPCPTCGHEVGEHTPHGCEVGISGPGRMCGCTDVVAP
jgi:hypothetical protein